METSRSESVRISRAPFGFNLFVEESETIKVGRQLHRKLAGGSSARGPLDSTEHGLDSRLTLHFTWSRLSFFLLLTCITL